MTSIAAIITLVAGFGALLRYARHDRFAGPAVRICRRDDLGCTASAQPAA